MVDIIWIIALIGFAVWWFVIADLDKAGILKKYNITAYGPLVMLRTFRGQKLLERIASPKKFWRTATSLGIPVVLVTMAGMLIFMLYITILMLTRLQSIQAPGPLNDPRNLLAIPGINQFLPFWWGWVALISALIVHEFAHAILAKVENIKVKSLGIMLVPILVGAFAEIDEEELFGTTSKDAKSDIIGPLDTKSPGNSNRKATKMQFIRILSAGVLANFLLAAVAFGLLFGPVLGSLAASSTNLVVGDVIQGSQANAAGIAPNAFILAVNGVNVTSANSMDSYLHSHPDSDVTVTALQDSKPANYTLHIGDTHGTFIQYVSTVATSPANITGLQLNTRIVSVNGTPIDDSAQFFDYMNGTVPGQQIVLGTVGQDNVEKDIPMTLIAGSGSKGYIGIDVSDDPVGIYAGNFNAQSYLDGLKSLPFSVSGWFTILALPAYEFFNYYPGFNVFHGQYASLFAPAGLAAPLGSSIFGLVDCLFWIGWLNFNVAIFNCLPMIPMDGGHVFREILRSVTGRFIRNEEKVDYISKFIVNWMALTLLACFVFILVSPYLVHGFG